MKNLKKLLLLSTGIILVSCNNDITNTERAKEKKIRVETAEVKLSNKNVNLKYSGLITPLVNSKMSFQVPGSIDKILIEEGDHVKKGDVLAELDKTTFLSTYRASAATQRQAQDAYDRLKKVYTKGSLPEIQWQEVISKLEQANSTKQISENNLKKCRLRAPKDGIIGSRNMELGTNALPGKTVTEVVSIKELYVKISVPENEINKIKKDQIASITIPAINQNTLDGKVERIGVLANRVSRTYEVKIKIDNSDLIIKPGMVCDVKIEVENIKQNLTIPSQAVIKEANNKNYVYLIDKSSHIARKQEVKVGRYNYNDLSIISGLNKGDIIVTNGQHKLKDTSFVMY